MEKLIKKLVLFIKYTHPKQSLSYQTDVSGGAMRGQGSVDLLPFPWSAAFQDYSKIESWKRFEV